MNDLRLDLNIRNVPSDRRDTLAQAIEVFIREQLGCELGHIAPQDPATEEQVRAARREYGTTDVDIDDNAVTSEADRGTWVSAWVWLAKRDEEQDHEE